MVRYLTLCFVRIGFASAVLFAGTAGSSPALAHDSWISAGGYRNVAGEWCCGLGDCFVVPPENVKMSPAGYAMVDGELVPFKEAQPSPDGAYWRCKRPDGTRRCFFAPPPGM
jgi:hypothetical protein